MSSKYSTERGSTNESSSLRGGGRHEQQQQQQEESNSSNINNSSGNSSSYSAAAAAAGGGGGSSSFVSNNNHNPEPDPEPTTDVPLHENKKPKKNAEAAATGATAGILGFFLLLSLIFAFVIIFYETSGFGLYLDLQRKRSRPRYSTMKGTNNVGFRNDQPPSNKYPPQPQPYYLNGTRDYNSPAYTRKDVSDKLPFVPQLQSQPGSPNFVSGSNIGAYESHKNSTLNLPQISKEEREIANRLARLPPDDLKHLQKANVTGLDAVFSHAASAQAGNATVLQPSQGNSIFNAAPQPQLQGLQQAPPVAQNNPLSTPPPPPPSPSIPLQQPQPQQPQPQPEQQQPSLEDQIRNLEKELG